MIKYLIFDTFLCSFSLKVESFSCFEDNLKKCDKTKYVIILVYFSLRTSAIFTIEGDFSEVSKR